MMYGILNKFLQNRNDTEDHSTVLGTESVVGTEAMMEPPERTLGNPD